MTRRVVVLDYETYYDKEYSLSKLDTLSYVRDERFEVHLLSFFIPSLGMTEPKCLYGYQQIADFHAMLRKYEATGTTWVCAGQNSGHFDCLISMEHFNFRFRHHLDTKYLARWALGNTLKDAKLETIAEHLGVTSNAKYRAEAFAALGMTDDGSHKKISIALNAVKGLRLQDITGGLLRAYMIYCDSDVELTWRVLQAIKGSLTATVVEIQDLYINAYLDMPARVDVETLLRLKDDYAETRDLEILAFTEALDPAVQFDGLKTIRSKDKFAKLLEDMGVPRDQIPLKQGKPDKEGNPRMIFAFAKNDMALDTLAGMYDDGESLVPEACRLRLEYNSSIAEAKMVKFARAGSTGSWAFAVSPFGAPNTARHSGASSTGSSGQNLKRAKPTLDLSCRASLRLEAHTGLRDVIQAPPGRAFAVADLSAIELRVCMTLCRDEKAMAILKDPRRDMYVEDGRVYFNRPDMSKKDKELRQAAKVVDLSAQYLVGWRKIHHQARVWGIPMTVDTAQLLHAAYRQVHPKVVDMWEFMAEFLRALASGKSFEWWVEPLTFSDRGVTLPSGFLIQYPGIKYDWKLRGFEYFNASRRSRCRVHPGSVVENCSQALAADCLNHIHLGMHPNVARLGGTFVTSVHDELLYSFPEGAEQEGLAVMLHHMEQPIPWWPDLNTRGEGDAGFGLLETPDGFRRVSAYGMLK